MSHDLCPRQTAAVMMLLAVLPNVAAGDPALQHRHGSAAGVRFKYQLDQNHCTENLYGTDGDDYLDGSRDSCDESIYGYKGNDRLIGGPGRNTLTGGKGGDTITGGTGADTFVFEKASDSTVDNPDTVTDFQENGPSPDVIDLSGLARSAGVSLSFIGNAAFTGIPGQVSYSTLEYWKCLPDAAICGDFYLTSVQVDLNGDFVSDFSIMLPGSHNLTANNFVL